MASVGSVIGTDYNRLSSATSWHPVEETTVTMMAMKQRNDQDVHKGTIEGDRPGDEQVGNPHGDGIDEDGLPDDPVAVAEDALGANEDETQG
jgi:hypothetical protein